eukprot:GHVL01016070.1.p1 GENE.GHVL01016070.1~~GHVL01016070.1.p1  ORF type:complete len:356 (-),score=96.03 GHVL01016070.1:983-2029(-)
MYKNIININKRYFSTKKFRSYYDVLGVSPTSSKEKVKKAFLIKAKRFHPDTNPDINKDSNNIDSNNIDSNNIDSNNEDSNNEDSFNWNSKSFTEVKEAYDVLSNDWKRNLYDQDIKFKRAEDSTWSRSSFYNKDSKNTPPDSKNTPPEFVSEETEEERAARQARYRNYASGNFTGPQSEVGGGTILAFIGIYALGHYICANAPDMEGGWDWFHTDDFSDWDSDEDYRNAPMVRAFYNPIEEKWERIPDGFEPPSPAGIIQLYTEKFPKIKVDKNKVPMSGLTVNRMLRIHTHKPFVLKDKKTGRARLVSDISNPKNNQRRIKYFESPPVDSNDPIDVALHEMFSACIE